MIIIVVLQSKVRSLKSLVVWRYFVHWWSSTLYHLYDFSRLHKSLSLHHLRDGSLITSDS